MLTSKYADHLPLNRLEGIFARHGVELSRSTLCDWVAAGAKLLAPLVEAMKQQVLASRKIHTDDTTVPVLDKNREVTRTGRLWVYLGDADMKGSSSTTRRIAAETARRDSSKDTRAISKPTPTRATMRSTPARGDRGGLLGSCAPQVLRRDEE